VAFAVEAPARFVAVISGIRFPRYSRRWPCLSFAFFLNPIIVQHRSTEILLEETSNIVVRTNQILVALAHALVGWALCAATMEIAMALTSLHTSLIIHAVAAPLIFANISTWYFKRQDRLSPLVGAIAFVGLVWQWISFSWR
jgi:hypothetical protein